MNTITSSLLLCFLLFSFVDVSDNAKNEAPVLRAKNGVRGRYIVVFKDKATRQYMQASARSLQTSGGRLTKVHHEYSSINGFAASMNYTTLKKLQQDQNVKYIEQDAIMRVLQGPCGKETGADWSISRVGNGTFTNTYIYPSSAGENVMVYIIDSGVYKNHPEIKGRAECYKLIVLPLFALCHPYDDNGHGTMVASLVAGEKLGIAKKAKICGVKVMNAAGSGLTSDIVKGVDWVTQQNQKGIINMSIGGGKSQTLDDATTRAHEAGFVVVAAAGNDNGDACNFSPASAPKVYAVAASDKSDNRASFSNYGICVKAFAPGDKVLAASLPVFFPFCFQRSPKAVSGTSFSSPITAGVLALHKSECPNCSPDDLKNRVSNTAEKDRIGDVNGTPNLLVHSGCPLPN